MSTKKLRKAELSREESIYKPPRKSGSLSNAYYQMKDVSKRYGNNDKEERDVFQEAREARAGKSPLSQKSQMNRRIDQEMDQNPMFDDTNPSALPATGASMNMGLSMNKVPTRQELLNKAPKDSFFSKANQKRNYIQSNSIAGAAGVEIPDQTIVVNPGGLSPSESVKEFMSLRASPIGEGFNAKEMGIPEYPSLYDKSFDRGGFGSFNSDPDAKNLEPLQGLVEVPGSDGKAFVKPEALGVMQETRDSIKAQEEADFYRNTLANARKTGFAENVFDRIEQTAAARREARGLADIPTEGLLNSLTQASNLSGTALTFGGKRRKEAADTIIDTFNTSGLNIADLNNAEKQRLITIRSGLEDPMSNTRKEATEQLQGLVSGSMLRRADEAAGRLNEDLAIGDTEREIKQNQLIVQNLTSKFIAGTATPEEVQKLGKAMKATAIIRDMDDRETQEKKISTAATYLTTISAAGQRRISSLQDQLEKTADDKTRIRINKEIGDVQEQVKKATKDFMTIYEGTNLEGLTANDLINNTDALKQTLSGIDEEGVTDTSSKEEPPEVTKPVVEEEEEEEEEVSGARSTSASRNKKGSTREFKPFMTASGNTRAGSRNFRGMRLQDN